MRQEDRALRALIEVMNDNGEKASKIMQTILWCLDVDPVCRETLVGKVRALEGGDE